jgi:hypothetical protein
MKHIWVERSWSVLLAGVLCAVLFGGAGFLAGRRHEYRVVKPELARLWALDRAAQAAAPIPMPEPPKAARASAPTAAAPADPVPTPAGNVGSEQELQEAIQAMQRSGGFLLPARVFLIPGRPLAIYLRTIVPVKDPEVFEYAVTCTCGFDKVDRRRVALAPGADEQGHYVLTIEARSPKGDPIDRRSVELVLVPRDAGSGRKFQMLMIGDSLGHANHFPDEFARLMHEPDNPAVEFVGSFQPRGATIPGEHYGGWQFIYFNTLFNQDAATYTRDRSPFVFDDGTGKPVFDFNRYLDETLGGARPRNVHIQLGINDAFLLDPDSPDLAQKVGAIIGNAETLIAGIRRALPDSIITVGSVIQANSSDRAFIESYPQAPKIQSEWRWRRVQMELARRMVDHFQAEKLDHVYLVPTHMVVDPLDAYYPHPYMVDAYDFKIGNAVHPSPLGDRQLAGAIYAVVKAELAGIAE